MLRQVADGVLIHQSEFLQNNAVVVQGRADDIEGMCTPCVTPCSR